MKETPHIPPSHWSPHQRYSRFVGWMKVLLPSLAVVLLGLLVAWPYMKGAQLTDPVELGKVVGKNLSMINPVFYGIDRQNRPFSITADQAWEETPGSGVILLQRPKSDFSTREGEAVYVESQEGTYYQATKILELRRQVNLYHENGHELHTELTKVDLEKSTAEGHLPVTGHGPKGALDGKDGFKILDEGKRIQILGPSQMNIQGAPLSPQTEPAPHEASK